MLQEWLKETLQAWYGTPKLRIGKLLCHYTCLSFRVISAKFDPNPTLHRSIKEDHGKPIYCVTFNFISEACRDVFASCGGQRVSQLCKRVQ